VLQNIKLWMQIFRFRISAGEGRVHLLFFLKVRRFRTPTASTSCLPGALTFGSSSSMASSGASCRARAWAACRFAFYSTSKAVDC